MYLQVAWAPQRSEAVYTWVTLRGMNSVSKALDSLINQKTFSRKRNVKKKRKHPSFGLGHHGKSLAQTRRPCTKRTKQNGSLFLFPTPTLTPLTPPACLLSPASLFLHAYSVLPRNGNYSRNMRRMQHLLGARILDLGLGSILPCFCFCLPNKYIASFMTFVYTELLSI